MNFRMGIEIFSTKVKLPLVFKHTYCTFVLGKPLALVLKWPWRDLFFTKTAVRLSWGIGLLWILIY